MCHCCDIPTLDLRTNLGYFFNRSCPKVTEINTCKEFRCNQEINIASGLNWLFLAMFCHLRLASGINLILSYGNVPLMVCSVTWYLYPNRVLLGLKFNLNYIVVVQLSSRYFWICYAMRCCPFSGFPKTAQHVQATVPRVGGLDILAPWQSATPVNDKNIQLDAEGSPPTFITCIYHQDLLPLDG